MCKMGYGGFLIKAGIMVVDEIMLLRSNVRVDDRVGLIGRASRRIIPLGEQRDTKRLYPLST